MAGPRILTFNFHEPYLCLMAKTGLQFTIGEYSSGPLARRWHSQFRPVPGNMSIVEETRWRADLAAGAFDLVIAHNESNAADLFSSGTPGLLVCHNRRNFVETGIPADDAGQRRGFGRLLDDLQEEFAFVFISETKQRSYAKEGIVIVPGIDVEEYGGYRGEVGQVLRVGNAMRARNRMFDVDFQERACLGLPNRVVGEDPDIPAAVPSRSWDDLLELFRSHRCYLHVSREEWEDGYNLAMLEAMAVGMPVVSLANATSPLTDPKDGYLSEDADTLRSRLEELLGDQDRARTIGEAGRETVARRFPMDAFVEKWKDAIESRAQRSTYSGGMPSAESHVAAERPQVLLEFMASPITTGRYFEEALRKTCAVITAGPRCPETLLEEWGFTMPPPEYGEQDIAVTPGADYRDLGGRLPPGFQPGLFVYVDSGMPHLAPGIESMDCIRVCYLIDTHIDATRRIEIARSFHSVFLAQKGQVEEFRAAGIVNVHWLPLACSSDLHRAAPGKMKYDVAYVGGLADSDPRRSELFRRIRERFPNSFIGRAWPHEMASIYGQSKIVVNACVNRDVNMRVFEAMAGGALLITDEAHGLEDLFEDGVHLAVYRNDEDVFDLIDEYLSDEGKRKGIAEAGRALVMAKHTYGERMKKLTAIALEDSGALGGISGESRYHKGGYYGSPRPELAQHVPDSARRVLDVGCGRGEFGRALKTRGVEEVVGIEVVERAWNMAKEALDDALLGSIEEMDLPFEDGYFDCVICGDVLEHLNEPSAVLRKLSRVLAPDGRFIISIPNVRFYQVVEMLVNGRWKYEDAGIMDRTHLRFFTRIELAGMIRDAGLELERLEPLSMARPEDLPLEADGTVTIGRATIRGVTPEERDEFLVYQYLVVAGKPNADPLYKARKALDENRYSDAYGAAERAQDAKPLDRSLVMAKAVAQLGQLDRAETHYRSALELEPGNAEAQSQLGTLLVAMNRPGEALALLRGANESDPSNFRILGALGLACLGAGDFSAAFGHLQKALELDPGNRGLLTHLIDTAGKLESLQDTVPFVERYTAQNPSDHDMRVSYGALLVQLGRADDGRSQLTAVLEADPDHGRARKLLSDMAQSSGTA